MTTMPQADAVDRIRTHLDQAQRDGRRPPGRPALVEATGLSEHAVRTALDKIKEGADASRPPTTTRHRQRAGDLAAPGASRQIAAPTGDLQPTTRTESAPAAKAASPADSRTDLAPSQPPEGISTDHPTTTSTRSPAGGTPSSGGTAVGWLGFAFGSVTSIAANVLHTWLPAGTQPPGWTPGLGPQLGAGVWPIALIVTVEVLTRVNWRQTWFWHTVRYGIGTIVAVGSFAISYGHIHAVLTAWHYDPIAAAIGPLVLDGLMTISGFALLSGKPNPTRDGVPKMEP